MRSHPLIGRHCLDDDEIELRGEQEENPDQVAGCVEKYPRQPTRAAETGEQSTRFMPTEPPTYNNVYFFKCVVPDVAAVGRCPVRSNRVHMPREVDHKQSQVKDKVLKTHKHVHLTYQGLHTSYIHLHMHYM